MQTLTHVPNSTREEQAIGLASNFVSSMATSSSMNNSEPSRPSLFHGPAFPPLLDQTLGKFLDAQCELFGLRECIIIPQTGTRWTYHDIKEQSASLARYLLSRNIKPGERVAIFAGNCAEYVAVFFACMRVGALLVILNNTYTPSEATSALRFTNSKILFAATQIGSMDNSIMLSRLSTNRDLLPTLEGVISLDGAMKELTTYDSAVAAGNSLPKKPLWEREQSLSPYDTCNLQFTSGSTGHPKAAMLTHHGLLNNARFIGDRMALTQDDVLCCPPPLFHCFGLVLGLLAVMTHGAKVIYPSQTFDPAAVLRAISDERCTALHGVPAMFHSILSLPRPADFDCSRLRTGIIAGAPVPRHLMEMLVHDLGMIEFTSSYGMCPIMTNPHHTCSYFNRLNRGFADML